MKSLKSIAAISLLSVLLMGNEVSACSFYPFYPYGYRIYRGYDPTAPKQLTHRQENCRLWQKLTSTSIPLEEIEEVIYDFGPDRLRSLLTRESGNEFAQWLFKNKNEEIASYLLLAKTCELSRLEQNSPWYYPSRSDGTIRALEDIATEAIAYEGTLLQDRYALQAIRALFALRDYQGSLEYWEKMKSVLPKGLIRDLCESYIAGARFRTGDRHTALIYYIQTGDVESIRFCAKKMGLRYSNLDLLELIGKTDPDCILFPKLMQEEMVELENGVGGWDDLPYRKRMNVCMVSDTGRARRLLQLCQRQLVSPKVQDRGFWMYSAACLEDLLGRTGKADWYLAQAEKGENSPFLDESVRVMRIYLDAKLRKYDQAYEKRLMEQLRWLDGHICQELEQRGRKSGLCSEAWKLKAGLSFFYWNDMLRRILISEVCPRMADNGRMTRALQLMNMADNYLPRLLGKEFDEEYRRDYNSVDFSNYFFRMADNVPTEALREYIGKIKDSRDEFGRYLNERGYTDADYLNDLLGTRYLRDQDYAHAVEVLGKVSPGYQLRTNVREYMTLDPFALEKTPLGDNTDYKYAFAREMLQLQQDLDRFKDLPDREALCLMRLGTGMRNAVGWCWTLTEYHYSYFYPAHDREEALLHAEWCFNRALNHVQDPELGAELHRKLCRWKTVVEKYPHSRAAEEIRNGCDGLCDYKTSWVTRLK